VRCDDWTRSACFHFVGSIQVIRCMYSLRKTVSFGGESDIWLTGDMMSFTTARISYVFPFSVWHWNPKESCCVPWHWVGAEETWNCLCSNVTCVGYNCYETQCDSTAMQSEQGNIQEYICSPQRFSLSKPNFMKFHDFMKFHEIFHEILWTFVKFHETFHELSWTFMKFHEISHEHLTDFFPWKKVSRIFMKFREFFHEIFSWIFHDLFSWNLYFMKFFMKFHKKFHNFAEWFSQGLASFSIV
jgi:hypothetical protein